MSAIPRRPDHPIEFSIPESTVPIRGPPTKLERLNNSWFLYRSESQVVDCIRLRGPRTIFLTEPDRFHPW